jgi:hypothetical protein
MPGLVPGIHVLIPRKQEKTWMTGTSPAMTIVWQTKNPAGISSRV